MTATLSREDRLAAAKARRAEWAPPVPPTGPECVVASCSRRTDTPEIAEAHAGRCDGHWTPLRGLVATMAGAASIETVSRRLFSEAMATTEMSIFEWEALADYESEPTAPEVEAILDRATRCLYLAGWYLGSGPRGGHYLRRRNGR